MFKKNNILLHTCCSPCSINIIKKFKNQITLLFYNPNINLYKEYIKRKIDIIELVKKYNIPFIDSDYNKKFWLKKIKKYSTLNEKNKRCVLCFKIRMEYTAYIANKYKYKYISTSLSVSNKKDKSQINICSLNAISKYKNIKYIIATKNSNKKNKEINYRQKYCGCIFSNQIYLN